MKWEGIEYGEGSRMKRHVLLFLLDSATVVHKTVEVSMSVLYSKRNSRI